MIFDVAALFVDPKGPYPTMPGVDWWDEKRDARLYAGPYPVVAHPPCGRWCRLAKFVEKQYGYAVGDDGGCFSSALGSVRKYGGILEHPAFSLAWRAHGLIDPPVGAGWQRTLEGEWVCSLAQSAYDHVCEKQTWLFCARQTPPLPTDWRRPKGAKVVASYTRNDDGSVTRAGARKATKAEAIHSPMAFAEYLVATARATKST